MCSKNRKNLRENQCKMNLREKELFRDQFVLTRSSPCNNDSVWRVAADRVVNIAADSSTGIEHLTVGTLVPVRLIVGTDIIAGAVVGVLELAMALGTSV